LKFEGFRIKNEALEKDFNSYPSIGYHCKRITGRDKNSLLIRKKRQTVLLAFVGKREA